MFPSDSSKEWDHFSLLTASCGILIIVLNIPNTLRNDRYPNILTLKQFFSEEIFPHPKKNQQQKFLNSVPVTQNDLLLPK